LAVAVALYFEVAEVERYLIPMAVEGLAEADGRLGEEGEVQIREELPHGAPTLGEDACPDGIGGADAEEDLGEDFVWQRAEAIDARGGVRRGLRELRGGDLAGAAGFHGPEQERWGRFGSARAGSGGLASS